MNIDPKAEICGLPSMVARALAREACVGVLTVSRATELANLGDADMEGAIAAMVEAGYLELAPASQFSHVDAWLPTEPGRELARASAARPISRASAQRAVTDLLARASGINADGNFPAYVTRLEIFGGFLGDAETLSEVEVTYETALRPDIEALGADAAEAVTHAHISASGRRFGNLTEYLTWPHEEVRLALKAGKRSIVLVPPRAIRHLGWPTRTVFEADPATIAPYTGPGLAALPAPAQVI
jgi:hypothetical protein